MRKKSLGSLVPLMAAAMVLSVFSGEMKSVQAAEVVLEDAVENAAGGEELLTNDKAAETPKQVTTITAEQVGDRVTHARKTLKMSSYGSNLLPTGVAALAGEQIKVTVEADEGKPLPTIVFTQQVGSWKGWRKVQKLALGENTFTVPRIYDEKWSHKVIPGGAIYIENPYTPEQQGRAPKITIEGGKAYPIFFDGDDSEAFKAELQEYKAKLEAEPEQYVDIVELVSDYAILNSNMASANVFLTSDRTPQKTLDFIKDRLSKYFALAGISETGNDIKHIRNHTRANMRLMQPWAFAYAANDHTGFQQGSVNNLFGGAYIGWAASHELGHHFDIQGGFIGEVTNNMWANYNAVDLQNEKDRIEGNYTTIFTKAASDDYQNLVNAKEINALAVWWQLYLMDQDYWANYQTAYRNDVAANMNLTKNERMAAVSSYAVGMDVTEHFERHKFLDKASADKVRAALKELNVPEAPENIKPWYMWTKATKDRNSSFGTNGYTPRILSVEETNGNLVLELDIEKGAQNALLGYEVLRDGQVIGFTRNHTFTTAAVANDGKAHTYKVRAFDLRLNVTGYSKEVSSIVGETVNQQDLAAATEKINQIRQALATALGEVDFKAISDIYLIQPEIAGYQGNEIDMKVVSKAKELLKKVPGKYSVVLNSGNYETVEELLNHNLYISYQQADGKPFYTYQNGTIVK